MNVHGRGKPGGLGAAGREGAVHTLGHFFDFTERIKSHHVLFLLGVKFGVEPLGLKYSYIKT